MLQDIKIGEMKFPEIKIKPAHLHKVRGYFSSQFNQFDLIHNHQQQTNRYYYRYPAVQFKVHSHLSIFAYKQEGVEVLKELFLKSKDIMIEDHPLRVREKEIEVRNEPFGEDGEYYVYEFLTPWLALNQDNYQDYQALADWQQKRNKLHAILINNIISFCKFAGYTIQDQLQVKSRFQPMQANLKGKTHQAFKGEFMINFLLPDLLGLGKSTSRGYGSILRKL